MPTCRMLNHEKPRPHPGPGYLYGKRSSITIPSSGGEEGAEEGAVAVCSPCPRPAAAAEGAAEHIPTFRNGDDDGGGGGGARRRRFP